jgi:thioredoxin 1
LWTLAIAGIGLGVYWLVSRAILKRGQLASSPIPNFHKGTPAILYFTTPDCAPCKTVQRPALEKLQSQLGADHLQVLEVNAAEKPELAQEWGVLSVPTTFILDLEGHPLHVNHGVTREDKLLRQLNDLVKE